MNGSQARDSLRGRHALICGASQGIGRAAAEAMAARGARLTLLARREDVLREVADGLPGEHGILVADLDDRATLREQLDALVAATPVHILVHNTGGPPSGPLLDATEDAILHALGRHLLTAHLMARAVLPGMAAAGYGRIINVLSTSVREPIDNLGVSNLTRAAVASWAKSLSRELPPGVTINNVLPGFTATPRLASLADAVGARTGRDADQVRAAWTAAVPEGRLADPSELGEAIAFLASPAASYVRGVSLPVDGGRIRGI
jgi:3-oxoacyl-[acyl-carrier protein] reductase